MKRTLDERAWVSTLALGALGLACLHGPTGAPSDHVNIVVIGDPQTWSADTQHPSGRGEFPAAECAIQRVGGVSRRVCEGGSLETWIQTHEVLCAQRETLPIAAVVFVGDMWDRTVPLQPANAKKAVDVLDDCGLPFYVLPGNHDADDGWGRPKGPDGRPFTDWRTYNEFADSFDFQPSLRAPPVEDPTRSPRAFLAPLSLEWWIFGAGYPRPTKAEMDWYDAHREQLGLDGQRLIWLEHDCGPGSDAKKPLRGDCDNRVHDRPEFKLVIAGHWCCGGSRRWWGEGTTLRDSEGKAHPAGRRILRLYNNDQHNAVLHGWATLVTLTRDSVTFEAWHPVSGKRGYGAIRGDGFSGRAASPRKATFSVETSE